MEQEIFRHLRSKWYDRRKDDIVPAKFGGISFLLKPVADKTYDFWVYFCPKTAVFSAKQAVKTLRERSQEGIVPFGRIILDDSPLIDQLIKYLVKEQMSLPSETAHMALEIALVNAYAERTMALARSEEKKSA